MYLYEFLILYFFFYENDYGASLQVLGQPKLLFQISGFGLSIQ